MNQVAATVLHACLQRDFESVRLCLRELTPAELRELQQAAMTLQNLAAAQRYAIAQQHVAVVRRLQEAASAK